MRPKGSLRGKSPRKNVRQPQLIPELRKGGLMPCDSCPLDGFSQKVPPFVPVDPILGVVGLGSGLNELVVLTPFVGQGGKDLRQDLREVGLPAGYVDDPKSDDIKIAFANLTRCRPQNDEGDFGYQSPEWRKAADHCWSYLVPDLKGNYPLLVFGTDPMVKFMEDKSMKVFRVRGLWHKMPDGREIFCTWHPVGIRRNIRDKKSFAQVRLKQYRSDLKKVADRVLGREKLPEIKVDVFEDLGKAKGLLRNLAKHKKPWAFDMETYDAGQFPSRRHVATDPFHPDFRIRGVAMAWRSDRGAWIDLRSWENRKEEAREILSSVFGTPAEKWAFNGGFDDNALVYSGWVRKIVNRSDDGMLRLIAVNAGGQKGFTQERLVVELLGEPQYWVIDKTRMEKLTIEKVSQSAVRDACSTFKLVQHLRKMSNAGEYLVPEPDEETL